MALIRDLRTLPVTQAQFGFFKDDPRFEDEKPYSYGGDLDPSQEHRRINYEFSLVSGIPVRDLRGYEHVPSLEAEGFEFIGFPTSIHTKSAGDEPIRIYMEEAMRLVKKRIGAEFIVCYEYRYRRSQLNDERGGFGNREHPDKPITHPHVDQTTDGGLRRARRHLSAQESAKFLNGGYRIRIVNLWQPLYESVQDMPLAFCDFSSVDTEDLIATDRIIPEYVGEIWNLRHNPQQRWYWISNMKKDEAALFISFDSDPEAAASFCPHASFADPAAINPPPRHSLEIRLIVISEL